ncbi:hypothetical protein TNCT_365361 [Trichonephila clavata]|uniref:Uncharacterized protein n=1 Tax=Trichonephila clavata TaxID=2740835 RepID=A0A8X6L670_TRICU|nr:hypothetical protein TNCT_365361 [Trichonephila clavata]
MDMFSRSQRKSLFIESASRQPHKFLHSDSRAFRPPNKADHSLKPNDLVPRICASFSSEPRKSPLLNIVSKRSIHWIDSELKLRFVGAPIRKPNQSKGLQCLMMIIVPSEIIE